MSRLGTGAGAVALREELHGVLKTGRSNPVRLPPLRHTRQRRRARHCTQVRQGTSASSFYIFSTIAQGVQKHWTYLRACGLATLGRDVKRAAARAKTAAVEERTRVPSAGRRGARAIPAAAKGAALCCATAPVIPTVLLPLRMGIRGRLGKEKSSERGKKEKKGIVRCSPWLEALIWVGIWLSCPFLCIGEAGLGLALCAMAWTYK
ncbi:uncharacterized protein K452DRAFT_49735 [Aplosporella prunicola CBS 121167]|uniref:Uncharacterized protein n=1 Tax=Aplosporella prunicola CBS 121167 TaxID=1176127 RepID=A0A6A6BBQ0_9PEZI|nr:uncharacterized protein K452DRAFT_49735 [Aplosporella prunicola CBS 121167]KAF2140665.1 hypothetical protein K452DRAFT_49735 [Aplosporella prunicola CBS 121167]